MNYNEALAYIHGVEKFGMVLGLDTIRNLLNRLGNPQNRLKFVHIAGTNGKGSTSAFVSNTLVKAGYRTGLYTSPFLERFNERIKIDGIDIGDQELAECVMEVKKKIDEMLEDGLNHPTEFEIITALAFYYFDKMDVDIVVLEVGLGGRYDATNVIDSVLVSAIASISKDHTKVLGDDIESIAKEKAGIIKKGSHVILYGQDKIVEEVIKNQAISQCASISITDNESIKLKKYNLNNQVFDAMVGKEVYEDIKIRMVGEYQSKNALLALNVLVYLKSIGYDRLTKECIYEGLLTAKWPARFEVVSESPIYILDGGHNLEGARALAREMERQFDDTWEKTLVLGILEDKEVDAMVKILAPIFEHIIVTMPDNPRAMGVKDLAYRVGMYCQDIVCIEDIRDAVRYSLELQKKLKEDRQNNRAISKKKNIKSKSSQKVSNIGNTKKNSLVVGAGSLFLVGSMRTLLKENKNL